MLFAGLDVGTSGCKLVVYDLQGNVKDSASYSYEEEGADGYRELNPVAVLLGVKECIKSISKRHTERLKGIAVGTLGESVVCIDEQGNPLGKSMVTGDKRGIAEVEEILEHFSKAEIMEITGVPASEMYSLPKFLWLNKNTDIFKQAKYVFLYEDYIGYYLTGKRKVSYSSASRTMAFDIRKKVWSEKLLNIAGVKKRQMSEPVESGTIVGSVLPEIAAELGLTEDVLIVSGGHDQECAALGAGVTAPGIGEDGHGTCEVMNIMLNGPLVTEYMLEHDLACVPGMIPETYMTNLEITTCGILMNWSRDCIFEGIRKECELRNENFFLHMDHRAKGMQTDLLILPQFGSAGNPNVSYDAKGLIWGLSVHTSPEEIYLAIKESMAFQMRLAYEHLAPLGIKINQIALTGGGAVSRLTLQLRADIFGVNTVALRNKEAGTLGCMIAAATAMGYYKSFAEGVDKVVQIEETFNPRPEYERYYEEKFETYKRLYDKMHDFK
jgi:xylulokinase